MDRLLNGGLVPEEPEEREEGGQYAARESRQRGEDKEVVENIKDLIVKGLVVKEPQLKKQVVKNLLVKIKNEI